MFYCFIVPVCLCCQVIGSQGWAGATDLVARLGFTVKSGAAVLLFFISLYFSDRHEGMSV